MNPQALSCPVCNGEFTPRRGGQQQVYCGPPCRSRANYLRNGTPAARGSRSAYFGQRWRKDPDFRQKRLEASRWQHIKRKYGLDPESYRFLLASQGNCCAICGTNSPDDVGLEWNVDHDHATGKVRGLLCRRRNGGLGWFKDNPTALRAAANYVERNR
ncbi:endonuclease VII domain-containing protein [Streptomyces triculaminicus]|uniref:Endonuclease VII domain-containing protein n=1 Tax=Streptomyces triculaminicus TaxID=2816232 RepID=A0A939JRE0_9ACTN|nr:endonuclease VII domain-containing protein [Streptomyces triculaminicus]MBO0654225.1 endonuclease VII domain-containing protein [Streptomyces triculaminicus]